MTDEPLILYAGIMKPGTKRLKELIKIFGPIWFTEKVTAEKMSCYKYNKGYYIRSENGKHWRNIQEEHFSVPL